MSLEEIINNISEITNYAFIRILAIILIALISQKIVKVLIQWLFKIRVKGDLFTSNKKDRAKRLKTLESISEATAAMAVWFVAILCILGVLNVPVGPLLTSAGLVGAALAFSTQSLIRDYISGIFIIAENQYRVDDYIVLDKVSGVVEAITVRTTIIRGDDGAQYCVPNGSISTTANFSFSKMHARQQIEISSDLDIEQIEKKLIDVAKKISLDPELSRFVQLGPSLISIDKITSKSSLITIGFDTTPNRRNHANNIIWKELNIAKIPFA